MRTLRVQLVVLFLLIITSFQRVLAAEITVAAAASLEDALKKVGANFEKATPGTKVVFNFAGSPILARQISSGAAIDIFFSADSALMNQLVKDGFASNPVALLSNRLVLVTNEARKDLKGIDDLKSKKVGKIGIGHEAVPVGHYAMDYLVNQKFMPGIKDKLVYADSVKVIAAQVTSKAVDVGFIYRTDFEVNRKQLKLLAAIEPKMHEAIVYPAAVLTKSTNKAVAQKFLDYLSTPAAIKVFQSYDFISLK